MKFQNPSKECDGNCRLCPESEVCGFAKIQPARYSRNSESGHELELRLGDAMKTTRGRGSYGSHYTSENYSAGFNNPAASYGSGSSYTSSASGFHGSYDASGGDYSKMSPKAGKPNYCSGAGCGKK